MDGNKSNCKGGDKMWKNPEDLDDEYRAKLDELIKEVAEENGVRIEDVQLIGILQLNQN
jgi:hypothetical protein